MAQGQADLAGHDGGRVARTQQEGVLEAPAHRVAGVAGHRADTVRQLELRPVEGCLLSQFGRPFGRLLQERGHVRWVGKSPHQPPDQVVFVAVPRKPYAAGQHGQLAVGKLPQQRGARWAEAAGPSQAGGEARVEDDLPAVVHQHHPGGAEGIDPSGQRARVAAEGGAQRSRGHRRREHAHRLQHLLGRPVTVLVEHGRAGPPQHRAGQLGQILRVGSGKVGPPAQQRAELLFREGSQGSQPLVSDGRGAESWRQEDLPFKAGQGRKFWEVERPYQPGTGRARMVRSGWSPSIKATRRPTIPRLFRPLRLPKGCGSSRPRQPP